MSAIVITLLRFGFLALLWIFVFFVLLTIKNDVFGTRITGRTGRASPPRVRSQPKAQASQARPVTSHLVVSAGSLSGTTIPLSGTPITVGRSPDSALVLDDGYTSARHARFFNSGGDWFVEDLNSTNGTWVGNERIYQPTRLSHGTPITIGQTTLELRR
ncbi:pSer/pThr/pTyr-binding forkhead associated (FHA) protein [Trueperella bonasi]|uniref:PSer/pThr/pTyr-binding forkhead associated (FHA) protein n=1 Tax=Trueperella bonasi TaxID=312286 RepID=A0ABT9NGL3_9ACTO|nr:FHA domain-containing protein [Trueperella bonasi]MDP9806325.1 pSer/pThr/pTyr-binding forkhead associated (FHA) protein [Trueperella bonasi]